MNQRMRAELEKHMESYINVDGLLPPSAEDCVRIEKHFAALG
jgi:hypothetical protein